MAWELFWDVETKSWFGDTGSRDPGGLGVSVVSVYYRKLDDNFNEVEGKISSFWEKDFDGMWKLFREVDRAIGFNSLQFDVPAMVSYAPADFARLPHFDILDQIRSVNLGRGASLNAIAKETLGRAKIDDGANAMLYWQKGDPQSLATLQKYCEADVLLTRDIYDFALKNGYLKFIDKWNNLRTVAVNFSYPKKLGQVKQSSLF